MPLLERGPLLATLGALLGEAGAGHGRLAVLSGEAGVGKTALVQEFIRSVGGAAQILLGACDPLSTPQPLGPLLDIASTEGGEIQSLLEAAAPRARIFAAFRQRLASARQPVLVVFEDVHWADDATLDLLRFLGRRLEPLRAMLVATFRDDEVGPTHPLRVVLGDLATAHAVRRLAIPPLSEQAVGVLAKDSGLDAGALHRLTGGNPFFVTEILASPGSRLPPTIRDAILSRVARLPKAAQRALEAAAIAGPRVEPWLLAGILGEGDARAIEACLSSGVLSAAADGLAFRNELAREAVLQTIAPPRGVMLHRRVLAILRGRAATPDAPARLAHHAEAAGDRAAVLRYAVAAADHARRLKAHREAAAQYARALRCADGLPPAQRAALLEARSYECYLAGQLTDALEARQGALTIWRGLDDRLKEGENLRWLSRLLWFLGRNAEAEEAGRAALAVLEQLPPGRELAWAYSNQAQLRMLARDSAEAVGWAERAIALARELGDAEILAHALNNLGSALMCGGRDPERGRAYVEESLRVSLDAGLPEHVSRALANLGSNCVACYRLAHAERYLDEGVAYCLEHDLDAARIYTMGWRAVLLMLQGRWNEATDVAASVLAYPQGAAVSRIQALVALGRVRARRGDPEVWGPLDEALDLALPTGELQRIGPVRAARSEAAWLDGDARRAADEARAGLALALRHPDPWFLGELACAVRRAGGLVDAPEAAAEPFALQLRARWAEAARCWSELGCPYEAAQALAATDDPDSLRRALAEFDRLGARPSTAAAARRLRQLGVRGVPRGPRPATRANPAQLTEREVDVLKLLVSGLRDAEIAQRLFVSPRTVGHHVSAVLAKLGARSRTEAVREAARLGYLPPR